MIPPRNPGLFVITDNLTPTGRPKSKPNLQGVPPVKTELGDEIRAAFQQELPLDEERICTYCPNFLDDCYPDSPTSCWMRPTPWIPKAK